MVGDDAGEHRLANRDRPDADAATVGGAVVGDPGALGVAAVGDGEDVLLLHVGQVTGLDVLGGLAVLEEAGLDRLIREGYALLHLQTYFTVGPKEARAWTIPAGTLAPQAAGVIHGDFERGFIRAETVAYEDFVSLGGEAPARDAGKLRAEGKTYLVKDGDVMHFLFNT